MEPPGLPPSLQALEAFHLADEGPLVDSLAHHARLPPLVSRTVSDTAAQLVEHAWTSRPELLAAFLEEYQLDSREGWIMMTLAETLLRIPDSTTADRLINDLLTQGNWATHKGHSNLLLINTATLGLSLGRRYVEAENLPDAWHQLLLKLGDTVFRQTLKAGISVLARQFVFGENIQEALGNRRAGYRYSFDMLGEAALTKDDATRYFEAYQQAILAMSAQPATAKTLLERDSISIKVSALHPRYEYAQWSVIKGELFSSLLQLCQYARQVDIPLTLDAEESDRLEISLALFDKLRRSPVLAGWEGLGLAVQAYQKRASGVVSWLRELGESTHQRIPVRLVKGAYWDNEIKRAQAAGLSGYPVFTRKRHSDVSYIACARDLLASPVFYPQFATHNAHTLACVQYLASSADREYEVQKLHGMGNAIHEAFREESGAPCRIYAPVGEFHTLLPYLVRRMLENGSNQSFMHQVSQAGVDLQQLVADPVETTLQHGADEHPGIPRPARLFSPRDNSPGILMSERNELELLHRKFVSFENREWRSAPVIEGTVMTEGAAHPAYAPGELTRYLGMRHQASAEIAALAMNRATAGFPDWSGRSPEERAGALEQVGELFLKNRDELLWLLIQEGGKTLADALSEWREAVDYCRYYAHEARRLLTAPLELPHVTGESNQLSLHGRGVFVCISPWNFPLAIFTGQIAAALVSGNTVVAKPASQTPLIATRAVELMHEAGIPVSALQLVPGSGSEIGDTLIRHPALAGVAFTGSTQTAKHLQQQMAIHHRAILPLIAETGGLNAMIADSSALPEQVVKDALLSAFNSAGQRCSALRVLWVQEDIADTVENLLCGAMGSLKTGNPAHLASDIGPVIDRQALNELNAYRATLSAHCAMLAVTPCDDKNGLFFAPVAFSCSPEDLPEEEVFGPVLHLVRFRGEDLETVINHINRSGYGLTLGIHSRVPGNIQKIISTAKVGNVYVNRNQIGAVVGCQPFGGEGLSGTGFKAGGPHYLLRFSTERCVSHNLTALGVNTALAQLGD